MINPVKKIGSVRFFKELYFGLVSCQNNVGELFRNIFRVRRGIVYLQTPLHRNIGDLAIAEATLSWLKERFPGVFISEIVYGELTFIYRLIIKVCVRKNDVIILHGGGNLGTWYPKEEEYRQYIINLHPYNSIVVMPQSVYFVNDITKEQDDMFRKVYGSHPDLLVCVRDCDSEKIARERLNCQIARFPDMVLGYQPKFPEASCTPDDAFVLLCLRNDRERITPDDASKRISTFLNTALDVHTVIQDMHIHQRIRRSTRHGAVMQMYCLYAKAAAVVTDRFHGGIFSCVTGTPCVILESADHKIRGGYEWLKNTGNIRLAENIQAAIDILPDLIGKRCNPHNYLSEFDPLEQYIRKKLESGKKSK